MNTSLENIARFFGKENKEVKGSGYVIKKFLLLMQPVIRKFYL